MPPATCAACATRTPADRDISRQIRGKQREAHHAEHGEPVEDPLDRDRRKRRAEPYIGETRGNENPHQLPGPEREKIVRHEADRHGVPQRGGGYGPPILVAEQESPTDEA